MLDNDYDVRPAALSGEAIRVAPYSRDTYCQCVMHHRPTPVMVELHHIFPQANQKRIWGRVIDKETVPLCSSGHDVVHLLLDRLIAGKPLPIGTNKYLLGIARDGLARIRKAQGEAGPLGSPESDASDEDDRSYAKTWFVRQEASEGL